MSMITNDWLPALEPEFHKPYYQRLYDFIRREYTEYKLCPESDDLFNAYHATPLKDVKVVILGNQPYSTDGYANGLAYAANGSGRLPTHLENIYKELHNEFGYQIPNNGDLTKWTKQGVFLLNNVLTVREHAPSSHRFKGWEEFTDATIRILNEQDRPMVYMLWGKEVFAKSRLLTNPKHFVLVAPHPSPLSAYRGFFGCNHFIKANDFLVANGLEPIDWQIMDK